MLGDRLHQEAEELPPGERIEAGDRLTVARSRSRGKNAGRPRWWGGR